jgi:hypothetical protein
MLTILGGLAEFERSLILARTSDGRDRAKARGVQFGRPAKLTAHQKREAIERLTQGEAQADVARVHPVAEVEVPGAEAGVGADRAGADAWSDSLKDRQRGRLDPCGSMVITGLGWDTSGGEHSRDGGFYRDFNVRFDLEAKKFATKFAPGSVECVPK